MADGSSLQPTDADAAGGVPDAAALRAAVAGVFFSGFGPLMVRNSPVDAAATAFWRILFALPVAMWLTRSDAPMPARAKLLSMAAGLLIAGDLVFWNRAVVSTTILEATLLGTIYPLPVALGAWLIFGQKVGRWVAIGGVLAFVGLVVMTIGPSAGQSSVEGNFYAIVAALFYAGCMLISGRLCQAYPSITVTAWMFVGAALSTLPLAVFEPRFLPADAGDWGYMAAYGALTLVAYLLINRGLGKLPTALVAVLGYGQPVIATLLAVPLLGEVPGLIDLLGGAVVVAGLFLATRPAATA